MIDSAQIIPNEVVEQQSVFESQKSNSLLYNEAFQLLNKVESVNIAETGFPENTETEIKLGNDEQKLFEIQNMHTVEGEQQQNYQIDAQNTTQWNTTFTSSLFEEGFSLDEFVFGEQPEQTENWSTEFSNPEDKSFYPNNTSGLAPAVEYSIPDNELYNSQQFDTRNQNFLDLISVGENRSLIGEKSCKNTHSSIEVERKRDYSLSSDSGVGSSIIWETSSSPSSSSASASVSPLHNQNSSFEDPQLTLSIIKQERNQSVQKDERMYSRSSTEKDENDEDFEAEEGSSPIGNGDKMSKKTAYNEKWGVKVLKAWCNEVTISSDFENLSPEELNNLLCRFWSEVRKSNGDYYGRNSLFNLRAMINKHLKGSPYHAKYDIVTDDRFRVSNERLEKQLKVLKGIGKTITHKQPITIADLRLMYDSGVLGMHSPLALLRKVWFEITLHFGHKGSESQEKLMNTSFAIFRDASNRAYVSRIKKSTKDTEEVRMYETGGDLCPVRSYQKYISKLHPLQTRLFQQPRRKSNPSSPMWYGKAPIGEKALQQMMANISVAAKLSKRYTNHCVRTTALEQFCDSRRKSKSKGENLCYNTQSRQDYSFHNYKPFPQSQTIPQNNHNMDMRHQMLPRSLPPISMPSPVRHNQPRYGKRCSSEMYGGYQQQPMYCQNNVAKRGRYDSQYNNSNSRGGNQVALHYTYGNIPNDNSLHNVKCEVSSSHQNDYFSDTVIGGHTMNDATNATMNNFAVL